MVLYRGIICSPSHKTSLCSLYSDEVMLLISFFKLNLLSFIVEIFLDKSINSSSYSSILPFFVSYLRYPKVGCLCHEVRKTGIQKYRIMNLTIEYKCGSAFSLLIHDTVYLSYTDCCLDLISNKSYQKMCSCLNVLLSISSVVLQVS